MSNGLFHHTSFDQSISKRGGGRCLVSFFFSFFFFIIISIFIEIPVVNTNSINPYETQHSEASDVGLHYLPIYLLLVSRPKWANISRLYFRLAPVLTDTIFIHK